LRTIDRIFQALLVALIFLAPMAFGSVYSWAYRLAEAACFAMFALWMLKLRMLANIGAASAQSDPKLVRSLGLPIGLLLLFVAFQSVPLPPPALRVISPATYSQYSRIFFDWPRRAPGADLVTIDEHQSAPSAQAKPGVNVTAGAIKAAPSRPAGETKQRQSSVAVPAIYSTRWRPLTIAWPLTTTGLIGALAVAALLFAVAFYPAGDERVGRAGLEFTRVIMIAVLVSALIIAVVGLIQWALWNGKILWTMVPLDWGAPDPGARRASGPFVNPDHFAGYLAMVFPFMLSGAVFGGFPAHSNAGPATRISCGVAAFLIFTAVALSQSRAGWMGLAIGTVALFFFVQSRPRTVEDSGADNVTARPLRTSLALLAAMVLLASMFVGGQGREESARRLGVTVSQGGSDLGDRFAVWSKTPAIVREFPLFGVGLGAWPEVFYRFQPAPRSELLYNAAHNDYIELLIDLGVIGLALLAWFAVRLAARLRDALRTVPRHLLPALAAMTAGLIAMGAIEFFDFDLQIPANLIAFAILAGLALRMSIPPDPPKELPRPVRAEAGPWSERIVYLPMAAAVGLAIFAMTQSGLPYPFDIARPGSVSDARNLLLSYPYNPEAHRLTLARFGDAMKPAMRSRGLATWEWLDPTDPHARDVYAQDLLDQGRRADAMRQISESVFVAPVAAAHSYLSPRIAPWLPDDQKLAIEDGLQRAVSSGFDGSVATLGDFYQSVGKSSERAAMLTQAAARENDPTHRAQYLRDAADAYLSTGQMDSAAKVMQLAIDADPGNADNYTELIARVLAPRGQFEQVQSLMSKGIDQGADACKLALSVINGANALGRADFAEQALDTALKADSTSYDCTMAMGELCLASGRNARAMLLFGKATELRPDSAIAYMELGTAADKNYDYFNAEKAYDRAASIAPGNPDVAERLAGFKRKMADAASDQEHPKELPIDPPSPDAQASPAADPIAP
jgi:O-antigen ligase/tetratricopeptide (TPR) repeat protein